MEIVLGVSSLESVFDLGGLTEAETEVNIFLPNADSFRGYYKERVLPEVFFFTKGFLGAGKTVTFNFGVLGGTIDNDEVIEGLTYTNVGDGRGGEVLPKRIGECLMFKTSRESEVGWHSFRSGGFSRSNVLVRSVGSIQGGFNVGESN